VGFSLVGWTYSNVDFKQDESLVMMQPFAWYLQSSEKNMLGRHLMRMQKEFPTEYDFAP